jgi:peptidoglycan hydrolase-like protein with peptidoglycan-binding domain
MKLTFSTIGLLLGLTLLASADEKVRRAQEELRKRNLYFGEVDGRQSDEVKGAILRYQTRKGLTPTGELNGSTLQSLEIPTAAVAKDDWPEGPVLKSDAARVIQESDRKLLEEIEPDLAPVAEESEEILSGPEAEVSEVEVPVVESTPPPTQTVIVSRPPQSRPAVPRVQRAPRRASQAIEERAREFVRTYLAACESQSLEAETRFYADPLDYFDQGKVGLAFVARDVQRFRKRWPQRQYKLLDFQLVELPGRPLEARFRISFQYHDGDRSVAGRTYNRFGLEEEAGELRFVSLREQRIRD